MNSQTKPKVVTSYDKLSPELKEKLLAHFPYGFDKHLVTFKNKKGRFVSALPYESEDRNYLVKMTRNQAIKIIVEERKNIESRA